MAATIPAFPWPVPRPSAIGRVDRSLLGGARTLGEVDRRLTRALASVGFDQSGRFTAPGGFVLVTRMERFDERSGNSWQQSGRFSLEERSALNASDGFSLGDYLRALLTAPSGRYRVLAFVATDQPVTPGSGTLSANTASAMVDRGADTLTEALDAAPFSPRHRVVVLIYEFIRPARGDPAQTTPSPLQGADHLRGTGVLRALAR